MNRCPNCAAQNRDGAKFCTSCGFRIPSDSHGPIASDRSPFATTSSMPPETEPATENPEAVAVENGEDERGFAPWSSTSESDATGPGLSWDSTPPKDTSVPVSDEMIASLVGDVVVAEPVVADAESQNVEDDDASDDLIDVGIAIEESDESLNEVVVEGVNGTCAESDFTVESTAPSIDQLLRLARELEYGLIELAESTPGTGIPSVSSLDAQLLANVLADLQSDHDLAELRSAVQTAQERPRDVDVMLGLVLHADAMASVLTERDQLKLAIEMATKGSIDDEPDNDDLVEVDSSDSDDAIPL